MREKNTVSVRWRIYLGSVRTPSDFMKKAGDEAGKGGERLPLLYKRGYQKLSLDHLQPQAGVWTGGDRGTEK